MLLPIALRVAEAQLVSDAWVRTKKNLFIFLVAPEWPNTVTPSGGTDILTKMKKK